MTSGSEGITFRSDDKEVRGLPIKGDYQSRVLTRGKLGDYQSRVLTRGIEGLTIKSVDKGD